MFGMDPYVSALPKPVQSDEPGYPAQFAALAVPPARVWVSGRLPGAGARLIAVVGSRATTVSAANTVAAMAAGLAAEGWAIVSGGALGIDAAAHRGALATGRRAATFAVLGCGADVIYPDRHGRLFSEIVAAGGGLLSEYPPGTQPRKGQFPARNRLVAALGEVVIVGASRSGSGALITARAAAALGRRLLAIPGSAGTDGLLARGEATPVSTAADVLAALAGKTPELPPPPARFAELLRAMHGEGKGNGMTADLLARRLNLGLAEVLGLLSEAELGGLVIRAAGATYHARFKSRGEAIRGH